MLSFKYYLDRLLNMTLNLPHDKCLHVVTGAAVYAAAHFVNPVVGLVAVVVAAVGKEVYDWFNKDKHTPELMDAVATVAGGLLGFICSLDKRLLSS